MTTVKTEIPDDEACESLESEYRRVCFSKPPPSTAKETKSFCNIFKSMCKGLLLDESGEPMKQNYSVYCEKHKIRFEFVCPDPIRFRRHSADALAFCHRYSGRCPKQQIPSEPVPIPQKQPYSVRELEYLCADQKQFAQVYCTNPVVLKLAKIYVTFCLITSLITLQSVDISGDSLSVKQAACNRNPHLPHCAFQLTATIPEEQRQTRQRRDQPSIEIDIDDNKAACLVLNEDFAKNCSRGWREWEHDQSAREFCDAFENVCAPYRNILPNNSHKKQLNSVSRDYTEFCRQHKQRYVFVCPDPFRFGQKAIVFCPLYAERCHVALPEKPEIPEDRTVISQQAARAAIDQLCQSHRSFAVNYCSNSLLLLNPNYRDACNKYSRFCT